jgi:hypothetical protein
MVANKESRSGESMLARWSRRKLEADKDASENLPAAEQAGDAGAAALPAEQPEVPVKPLTDADMPDLATLSEESDFSGFMSPGVSDELRNLALRKLFHAPVFNIRDGFDDYDEDYTSFEKLGDIVTSDMKHQVEMQQRKLREALELEQRQAVLDEAEIGDAEAVEGEAEIVDENDQPASLAAADDEAALHSVKKTEAGNG